MWSQARFLHKHKRAVNAFYRTLSQKAFSSETALIIVSDLRTTTIRSSRFSTTTECLGTTTALKHASPSVRDAPQRPIGGSSSKDGIQEYLILMSIYETCRPKRSGIFGVLRSGEKDIDAFAQTRRREERTRSPIDGSCSGLSIAVRELVNRRYRCSSGERTEIRIVRIGMKQTEIQNSQDRHETEHGSRGGSLRDSAMRVL